MGHKEAQHYGPQPKHDACSSSLCMNRSYIIVASSSCGPRAGERVLPCFLMNAQTLLLHPPHHQYVVSCSNIALHDNRSHAATY